jgi:glycine/D-amino acid oxidase-like deaminating enzyme/nitrite reductase/ring-hydroxylating ferredoxin subunit
MPKSAIGDRFAFSTRPIWHDSHAIPKYSDLNSSINVDVCIIGAGITGLTTAYLLTLDGLKVAVIDNERVCSGETGNSTAHITEVFDIGYRHLVNNFGIEGAKLASQSMRRSIERIERNINELNLNCDFKRVPGFRFAENSDQVNELEDELLAALSIGLPTEIVRETPLPFKVLAALQFQHQAQINPLKYLGGLANRIVSLGGSIFEETRMSEIKEGEPCQVHTDRGIIFASDVVVAANVPSGNKVYVHTKIAAYRSYAIAFEPKGQSHADGLFWSCESPYQYIRSHEQNHKKYLIVGGEDHKTGHESHTSSSFKNLEAWSRSHFAFDYISYRWSGQIILPADGLPYIGRNPRSEHIYIATGYSGTGMTFGTVAAMLISDLITDRANPWTDLYDAKRVKPLAGAKAFISENFDYPSHLISDRITLSQATNASELRENEGAIIRNGAKKVAAYRDTSGELHLLSPVCPHLGCYVHWNEFEKSWDCPCHGSRFSAEGKLLNGPSVSDLASEDSEDSLPLTPQPYETPQNPDEVGAPIMLLCKQCKPN